MSNKNEMTSPVARAALASFTPDELKRLFRDALLSMTIAEREDSIRTLETEMRRANVSMRALLVPLGIPGRSSEDLTPSEVGHLIRFVKMVFPEAMPAVERVAARFCGFAKSTDRKDRLAA